MMLETTQTVTCPIEGYEWLRATYQMMALFEEIVGLRRTLTAEAATKVVTIEGWDEDKRGPFWSNRTPMALMLWAAYQGRDQAAARWVSRPLPLTE